MKAKSYAFRSGRPMPSPPIRCHAVPPECGLGLGQVRAVVERSGRPVPNPPMSQAVLSPSAVEYPSSDDKPMDENDAQRDAVMYAIGILENRYAHRADVYVSGDLLVYYEEGNPRASVVPNAFVVFGAEDRQRPNYKLWEEPKAPDFVLEVASPNTWRDHEGRKRVLYERLGVREYWQYDPTGEHLGVRLKGHRLVEGAYEPQPVAESMDGTLSLRSETLGLDLWVKGDDMYFLDPAMGRRRRHREAEAACLAAESRAGAAESRAEREAAARRTAESRAEREAAARRAAEAWLAEFEALVARKR